MTDHLMNSQDQVQRPRRSRKLMAAGALAAALAVGGGVSIAAAASPVQPAGGAVSTDATGTLTATTAGTTGGGSSSKVSPLTAGSRPTPPAPRPHMGGTVTAVGSGTITIKDHDGFRRQIKTSSKTVYADGLKSPVAIGTHIEAEGTVDANGTSLDATTIHQASQPGDGGPGRGGADRGGFGPGPMGGSGQGGPGQGGPGKGGPGGHDGSAPTPPSGAPAAPLGAPAAPSGAPSTSTSAAPTS